MQSKVTLLRPSHTYFGKAKLSSSSSLTSWRKDYHIINVYDIFSIFRFLELKLRTTGCQGLYLTISTRDFRHSSKGFVKLAYSLTSNFPKATRVINEADVFDREGSGWGYEEFFPLSWTEFKDQLKRTPLIITSQVSLLE